MLTKYQGESEAVLVAINKTEKHEPLLITGKISKEDLTRMSYWLSDSTPADASLDEKLLTKVPDRHTDIRLTHPGRIIFDFKGCRSCHGYASRRGATMVRDMLATYEGAPESALEKITSTPQHSAGIKSGTLSAEDHQKIAEWIGGAPLPKDTPAQATVIAAPAAPSNPVPVPIIVTATEPVAPTPSPAAPTEVVSMAVAPATPAPIAPAIVSEARPAASSARPANPGKVTAISVKAGQATDRLTINLSGAELEGLNIRGDAGRLIISLPRFALAETIPDLIGGFAGAKAVESIEAQHDDRGLTLTVIPRKGDLKHDAMQGRNRINIDIASVPSKRAPAPVATAPTSSAPPAPAAPPAKAKPDATQAAADKAKLEAETKAKREADAKIQAKRDADERARKEAEAQALARKEADDKARREAEAKAKREAEAQALARKESAAKAAAKKESDEGKGKADAADAAKRELEMLAALKASAEALKGGAESASGGGRKDRSKLKRPEKFRDDPCPPISESEPIGHVDEKRAKDIMERVGCTQCHAQVQVKTGPPLKRVFEKVKGNPSCVVKMLKNNKEHKEEGVTDDLKGAEFKIVADYYATRVK